MSNNTMLVMWSHQGRDRLVDGSVGEHFKPGEQKALNSGCSCNARRWIPGTAGLVLTSTGHSNWVPPGVHSLRQCSPFVLGPPDSDAVHTGSLSSVGGSGSVWISDWLDPLCLRGTVGDSEARVWQCKSVCVHGAGSAGCTVWSGECEDTGSSGDVEGTDSAGVVGDACTGCNECVDSWACDVLVGRCWVHGSFCLCGSTCVHWACVFAICSTVE